MSFKQIDQFPDRRQPGFSERGDERRPARARPLLWFLVLIAMAGWSLLAWFAFSMTDPVLAWLATNVAGLVQQGQGAAEVLGGKQASEVLKSIDAGGLAGQLLQIAALVAKPAIVLIWGIGMLGLLMLAVAASAVRRLLTRGR